MLVRSHRRKLAPEYFGDDGRQLLRLVALLRIAAVLHRNRSHESMPHVGAVAAGDTLTLTIDPAWMDSHPLTRLDLVNEAEYLQTVGLKLKVQSDEVSAKAG